MWWNWWLQLGNHCKVDNAMQQPLCMALFWSLKCTQSLLERGRSDNHGAVGKFRTYWPMISDTVTRLPRRRREQRVTSFDCGRSVVFEWISFEKHVATTWMRLNWPFKEQWATMCVTYRKIKTKYCAFFTWSFYVNGTGTFPATSLSRPFGDPEG
jgi:hypothetical protein